MPLTPEAAADLSAATLTRAYVSGDADPVAVTEVCLNRIDAAKDASIFITISPERARAEAKAAKARYEAGKPAGPLDGVPFAWKDLFDVAGTPTTAASALLRNAEPAEHDAPVVAHCATAGLVSLGKVNLTEFAYSGIGLNPHFGTPANPYDQTTPRAPGGSSSGSAVAVAAGLSVAAAGSDTGGSVRVPAAFNGLAGYKSSEGRIDARNTIPLSYTLDTVGPLARTVEDCILLDAAMRGSAAHIEKPALSDLKLVVPTTLMLDDLDDAVAGAFEALLTRLSTAGVRVREATLQEFGEAADVMAEHGTIATVEAYHYHRERVDGPDVAEMDGRVVARIMRGKTMTALDLLIVQRERRRLATSVAASLNGELLLCPTVAHVAPEIAPLDADPEEFNRVNLKTLRNTMVGNMLNMPGVAIPMASDQPLPVSALISAPADHDEQALAAAWALEMIAATA
ncbi:MAG: amidase family protein [Pseudomonadota bacterium]